MCASEKVWEWFTGICLGRPPFCSHCGEVDIPSTTRHSRLQVPVRLPSRATICVDGSLHFRRRIGYSRHPLYWD